MKANVQVTPVFQWIDDAVNERCHVCSGSGIVNDLDCDFCGGSGRRWRYIILEGSSRSSKTRSCIQYYHRYACEERDKRLSVWRDNKKLCKDTVGNDMRIVFPGLPFYRFIVFNKTESIYHFPLGSAIEINGTDDPNKVHGYNGHVVWIEEPYKISEDTFNQLDQRTEDFILISWNPIEAHWIDNLKKNQRAIVIHSTFKDNPFCPPEQKRKILSYQPLKMCSVVEDKTLTEEQARFYDLAKNELNFSDKVLRELARCKENERTGSASVYNWSVYGLGLHAEKPNRIFFWEEIEDHVYHSLDVPKYYGIDWGVVDPWGIIEAKYYDGAMYFHELNYSSENEIKANLTPAELQMINADQEGGLVKWKMAKLNVDKNAYIVCDNNRPLKITALQDAGYEYAIAAPKPPGSIIDGINLLSEMKCYYTRSSSNIRIENQNYSRKVDNYGVVLEEPEDTWNHTTDPARYIALFLKFMGIIKK